MKIINLFFVAFIVAAVISSCAGNGNNDPKTANDDSKVSMKIDGVTAEVDTFTVNHYPDYVIKDALEREEHIKDLVRPTDASTFGQKKAKVVKRAFNANVEEKGVVTIIFYEKGLEIIKEDKSWFYDRFIYDDFFERSIRFVSAAESILHPGVWEPIWTDYLLTKSWECHYIYDGDYEGRECFYIREYQQNDLVLHEYSEWIVSKEIY